MFYSKRESSRFSILHDYTIFLLQNLYNVQTPPLLFIVNFFFFSYALCILKYFIQYSKSLIMAYTLNAIEIFHRLYTSFYTRL